MITENKLTSFKHLVRQSSREELIWLNGYLAGLLEQPLNQSSTTVFVDAPVVLPKPTIIYGTETGNSKKIATQLQATLKKVKVSAKLFDASQYPVDKIEQEEFLVVVMSTQGEGEPPQSAAKFFQALFDRNFQLQKTQFAVFGLGDTAYPLFCQAATDVDKQLEQLGAKRAYPLQKADTDYAVLSQTWIDEIVKLLTTQNIVNQLVTRQEKQNSLTTAHKQNYIGQIKHKVVLNDRGSNKQTYHIEIESNEKVVYACGDALGVYPKNNEETVQQIATFLGENLEKEIVSDGQTRKLADILAEKSVRNLGKKTIEKLNSILQTTIQGEKIDLLDVLSKIQKPVNLNITDFLAVFSTITPRLYSIASSPEAHENEVHLTVGLHKFKTNTTEKIGLCSNYLANYPKNTKLEFYIHKNNNFRLPAEDKDVIMIGAGTGVAPFRGFLFQRDAENASGRNWLVFGEQYFALDFYYQTEIQEFLAKGVLNKLSTAFSRDTKQKIYVQHRLKEEANTLYEWLQNGAYLYVCGQKSPMSIDVENTLVEIIAEKGQISTQEAQEILAQWESEGRYLKDVY
jgi:sulfite reductase (NADPH) flavoprotein alpha-component